MMNVKFLELGRLNARYMDEFASVASDVFRSGTYIGGEYVTGFEAAFASFCGSNHCVSLANGLDALIIALRALNVGRGDEVIVPGQTFVATWLAVSAVGATPVPVDVELGSANIDVSLIEAAITPHTKAIIPVHLYGEMASMREIIDIAQRHSLYVVEDSAQAHGAKYQEMTAGSVGHIGCFSFYPSKNLGALGDAGAIITNDERLADRVRLLANYGSVEKYIHRETGMNSRMDPIQAAFLTLKLKNIETIIAQRKAIAERYTSALASKNPDTIRRLLVSERDCVWHNFVVCVNERDRFVRHMSDLGVGTALHYPIIPSKQECYLGTYGNSDLPTSDYFAKHGVSLPIGEYLSHEEVEYVAAAIDQF